MRNWSGLQEYKAELGPVIMDILRASSAADASTSGQAPHAQREGYPLHVLNREAAYNAAALGVWSLIDTLDFSTWLHSSLLQVQHTEMTCLGCLWPPHWILDHYKYSWLNHCCWDKLILQRRLVQGMMSRLCPAGTARHFPTDKAAAPQSSFGDL